MSSFGPLPNQYRKRKRRSLDGSVPGVEYNHFRRPTTPPLGSAYRGGTYRHKLYFGDLPHEYHPNIEAPAVQGRDYDEMQTEDFPVHGLTLDERRFPSVHRSEIPPLLFPTAEDDLALEEQFLMDMGARPRPQEGPVPVEPEEIRHLLEGVRANLHSDDSAETEPIPLMANITDALSILENVLPEDHPDIVNLRRAQRILDGQGLDSPAAEMASTYDVFERDPVAEAQQIFDQQMQQLDKAFELPAFREMNNPLADSFDQQQAVLEQMLEHHPLDIPFMEAEGLEQLVEPTERYSAPEAPFMEPEMMPAEVPADMGMPEAAPAMDGYDLALAHEEINQAIDHVTGQAMPHETMPQEPAVPAFDPALEDPWQLPQYLFDPTMQQLNPYQMPDPLGFGPLGPTPGPGM